MDRYKQIDVLTINKIKTTLDELVFHLNNVYLDKLDEDDEDEFNELKNEVKCLKEKF